MTDTPHSQAEETLSDSTEATESTVNEDSATAETTDTPPADKVPGWWNRRTKTITAVAAAAVLIAGTGLTAAAMHHPYTIDVDGNVLASSSWNGTVASALEEHSIQVGEHDKVTPALDTELVDGMTITVDKARQTTITIDGKEIKVWSTADSTRELLSELATEGRNATIAASRGHLRSELPLVLTDRTVPFTIGGKDTTVEVKANSTLETALKAAQVELGEHDTVKVTEKNGDIHVDVTRIEIKERVETAEIPFEKKTVSDDSLYKGRTKVTQEGVVGEKRTVFRDTITNGTVTDTKELKSEVSREPVTQIIAKGTKPVPVAEAAPSGGGGAPTSGVWAALAQCESGGNPRAVSGPYHGLYQFSVSTWRSVGGQGLPSQASPAEQLKRAKILQARSGWGQWPACSRKIGVR